jgi:SAM-dependent methyltransferase
MNMFNKKRVTVDFIQKLSYPDFVGFINQWNTPPGSYVTLSKWAVFSKMAKKSYILDVGCSTGFSSRELVVLSGSSGKGFDSSQQSIQMANYNKARYSPNANIFYEVADGYFLKPQKKKFTHIVVGGNLIFFSDPEKMLSRCVKLLRDGGYILATAYYQTNPMPQNFAQRVRDTLGIPPSRFFNASYKETMALYNKLEIIYEDRNVLMPETEEELCYYGKSIIDRACEMHNINNQKIYSTMYKRLLSIRRLINQARHYQGYCVLVLRYRKSVYPHRYVGLF